jgi:hypothetical protein
LHCIATVKARGDVPITTSQLYGWDAKPLMRTTDPRFHHPKIVTEITKVYGAMFVKNQPEQKIKQQ